jgi:Flp pilus assembly protein TadB
MKRARLAYMACGAGIGLVLVGIGWGSGNYYLVSAGAFVVMASLAWLTMPMPLLS